MDSELKKCLNGESFNTSDKEIQSIIHKARKLTKIYNSLANLEGEKRLETLKQLLGKI